MRKYMFSVFFILAGLLLILIGLLKRSENTVYVENVFAEKSSQFNLAFTVFIDQVRSETEALRKTFFNQSKIRDTLFTRNYFLNKIDDHKELITLGVFQTDYNVVAGRDGNSTVYAVDSTEKLDVVRWQRFEKGNKVSSWNESLEDEIELTQWYKKLLRAEDQFTWFLRNKDPSSNQRKREQFVYCGYSYLMDGANTIIVMQFSTERLLDRFEASSNKLSPLIVLKTTDGRMIDLITPENTTIDNDSLIALIDQHHNRFEGAEKGIFNFSLEHEDYWNSFSRFPGNSGIAYYLYTLNSKNLESFTASDDSRLSLWSGTILTLFGFVLLGLRKRFFYSRNRMKIPDLDDILKEDENRYLEFKSSLRWDYRQEKVNSELEKVILKTLAAFGNTDGGILLIGVDDDKNVIGLEKDFHSLKKNDSDYYEIHLRNILHKEMGVKYVSKYIRTQFETTSEGKVVCKIRILPGDEPVFLRFKDKNGNLDEKFFVRSGNSSHEIESIAEINDYVNKKYRK